MATKVKKLGVKREKGFLYFLDKDGDLSKAKLNRGAMKGKPKPRRRRR